MAQPGSGQRHIFKTIMNNSAAVTKTALLNKLPEVCQFLFPKGHPDGCNYRVGSIKGEDGSSLSVCLQGTRKGCWKDFADISSRGDILSLWMRVRNVSFPDALREARTWLSHASLRKTWSPEIRATEPAPEPSSPGPIAMPSEIAALWDAGVTSLATDLVLQSQVDTWRGWPAGTTAALATSALMGCPHINGEAHFGFPVQHPTSEAAVQVGFHARPMTTPTGRGAGWRYRPNSSQDGVSMPVLPFALGSQEFATARLVVITEGQWDAVAFAAAAGWLGHSPWPPGVSVFGIRGATTWRSLLSHWKPFWPPAADFLVIPDADEAGRQWNTSFADQLKPHALNLTLWALPAGMDFSDFNQAAPLSPANTADIIECLGLQSV